MQITTRNHVSSSLISVCKVVFGIYQKIVFSSFLWFSVFAMGTYGDGKNILCGRESSIHKYVILKNYPDCCLCCDLSIYANMKLRRLTNRMHSA